MLCSIIVLGENTWKTRKRKRKEKRKRLEKGQTILQAMTILLEHGVVIIMQSKRGLTDMDDDANGELTERRA